MKTRSSVWILAIWLGVCLAACGSPQRTDPLEPEEIPRDSTPVNQELALSFDGEAPDFAVGPDGTLHMVYRKVEGQSAKVYYVRKAPLSNDWTSPAEVPGSANSAWRWFNHPKIAVNGASRVYMAWGPEPYASNGSFLATCQRCDGTDFRTVAVTPDTTEGLELGVSASGVVHLVVAQLDRAGERRDQMVHYISTDEGQSFQSQPMTQGIFRNLAMEVDGDDVHVLMRFTDLRHARFVLADGTRHWESKGLPTQGFGVSEMFPMVDGANLTGYFYGSWGPRWPERIYFASPGGPEAALSGASSTPNNLVVAVDSTAGERLAVWCDSGGLLHFNAGQGQIWRGDALVASLVRPVRSDGHPSRAGVWQHFGDHGNVLWPVLALARSGDSFHLVFRAMEVGDPTGLTEVGRFHYVRFQPF